ncbi:Tudor/PWWP/MBT superfamily protein [Trifolium repens]|nr:Tudor/PWWP/MBT superfamily protein [Trifolium repens]
MAVNYGQIDLNAADDAVLFDQENQVLGFNSTTTRSNVINNVVGVSFTETLITHVAGTNGSMDKGLVFGLNGGVQIQQECENVGNVALSNEVPGIEDHMIECDHKVNNAANLANLSAVVDSFVNNEDNPEDCRASEGFPYAEDMNVNEEESLDVKDSFSMNCHEIDSSYELKQPAFLSDAQVDVTQNQTTDINISGTGISENIQHDCRDFDLVVDLNSFKNTRDNNVPRESVFSEDAYRVSDLVWGKVRGHPWWPGQIYDPSIASEKAKRHRKENCYLIAYFGDQTFAWNDVSMIKPFHKHFSEMEKQSDLENFRHAVDCALEEASRRVESGLSCPCMPGEVSSKLKTQVIANAATSFEPTKLLNFVKSLAQSPFIESDRLDFVSARAQLSAFYHSKGYSQLPEFGVLGQLFASDMDQFNEQILMTTHQEFSQKSQHISRNTKQTGKKKKHLSDLMSEGNSWTPNGECTLEKKAGDNTLSRRGRKRKAAYNTSDECFHNVQTAGDNSTSRRGRKRKLYYDTSDDCFNNSQTRNITQLQNVSIDEMRSQLCLAAKDPANESCFNDMIHFFAEFKKFTGRNASVFLEQGLSLEQEPHGETGEVTFTEAAATASISTPTPTPMDLSNDSYWTDRIIQSISEEETLLKKQNEKEELLPPADISPNTDENLGSEPSNLVEHVNESSPTSLTLKFTTLDLVPSKPDLNKIFGRFGPLIESKTELLEKTNRARVVFERRCDAETAFSSAGKYSIFGPSLQSYRLKILPRTPNKVPGKRGRKSKKEKCSMDAAAV